MPEEYTVHIFIFVEHVSGCKPQIAVGTTEHVNWRIFGQASGTSHCNPRGSQPQNYWQTSTAEKMSSPLPGKGLKTNVARGFEWSIEVTPRLQPRLLLLEDLLLLLLAQLHHLLFACSILLKEVGGAVKMSLGQRCIPRFSFEITTERKHCPLVDSMALNVCMTSLGLFTKKLSTLQAKINKQLLRLTAQISHRLSFLSECRALGRDANVSHGLWKSHLHKTSVWGEAKRVPSQAGHATCHLTEALV